MFVVIPLETYVRIAGAGLAVAFGLYDNKLEIWKMTHKKEYRYLIDARNWWSCSPISCFDRWLEDRLWDARKSDVYEKWDLYATELHCSRIYQNAPAKVRTEANLAMKKLCDDAIKEIEDRENRWEQMAKKIELDRKLAKKQN